MINTTMSKRTDEMLVLERNPSQTLTADALRRLILGGTLGPAVRARYANDDAFLPWGSCLSFAPFLSSISLKRQPLQYRALPRG